VEDRGLQHVEGDGDVIVLAAGPVPIGLSVYASGIIRVRVGLRAPGSPASYLPERDFPRDTAHDATTLDAGDLVLRVEPTRLTFHDRAGRELIRLAVDEIALAPRARLRFEIVGEQHFYGLGEGGQQFDRLGASRRLWNYQASRAQGADMAIPLLVSQAGYAIFFDNAAAASIEPGDIADGTCIEYQSEPGALDLCVIGGANLRAVMRGVADLLGHATMPPRWALGYLQSSRHFENAEEVRQLAAQLREKRLPCDALIFLSTYGAAKGWNKGVGHLEFEPDLFADPAAMLGDFRRQNFRVISHEYPVLHPGSPLFRHAERQGYLLDCAYPMHPPGRPRATNYKEGQRYLDFSREEVRTWWWRAHRHLVDRGIAGWWLDGGEGPPASEQLDAGAASILHNRYDLLRQQAFADGEAADNADRRPFLLCRSGGPGMQRFGAMPWSGDVNTTFETFETQIRIGLNVGMSGVPHWGTDIGGFFQVAPDQGELFARWFQFGAFCSIFRAHGHVWRRHLPWSHGEAIEAICRKYLELRYQLMPYTYTLAWQAHREGLPLMRPLVLNHPDDPRVWDLGTQYLWGDDLLVAPVSRAGATHWPVYLPAGTWHDFWTDEVHEGPASITAAAPLDRLPLFVRAGAIVPLGPVVQYDGERALDEVTLLVYPDVVSAFTLYEDDGVSNDYRHGRSVRTTFTCRTDEAGITCAIEAPDGDTSLIPHGRSYAIKLCLPHRPRAVAVDRGGSVVDADWRYESGFVHVRVSGAPLAVRVVW
jgi:alpha-glucosidase (family GH31 glycosyl hydrolase)